MLRTSDTSEDALVVLSGISISSSSLREEEDVLTAQHVVLVVIVSVATPLLAIIAVTVLFVLKRKKRLEQRRNDRLARIQNEQNTVQCIGTKTDPHMILNTLHTNKCSNLHLSSLRNIYSHFDKG